ncbi:hypothetical protein, partial [Thalassolituus sp.]|uniref:hypothetical protein n=1 Tax=Thalassolituus sp. TaxID=2030822 RepID=UPI0035192AC8
FKVDYGPAFVDPYGVVILEGVVGTISITAAQGGSAYFHPALPVTKTFVVSFQPEFQFCQYICATPAGVSA